MTKVYMLKPENLSYRAKGAAVQNALVEAGLERGGMVDPEQVKADPEAFSGGVFVIADRYNLHEDSALDMALQGGHVVAAPSVLHESDAAHAAQKDHISVVMPKDQSQKIAPALVDSGKVALVEEVSAAMILGSLETLDQDEESSGLMDEIHTLINRGDHVLIYPPGHFDGGKQALTPQDIGDMKQLIGRSMSGEEGERAAVVICGGRVSDDVVCALEQKFASNESVVIVSQNRFKDADLPSAYLELCSLEEVRPCEVCVDALAGTTLKVLQSAGYDNIDLILSERMAAEGHEKRADQAVAHMRRYGGDGTFVTVGNIDADKLLGLEERAYASHAAEPADTMRGQDFSSVAATAQPPRLQDFAASWVRAKGLVASNGNAPSAPVEAHRFSR